MQSTEYYNLQVDLSSYVVRHLSPIATQHRDPRWLEALLGATQAAYEFSKRSVAGNILGSGALLILRGNLMHLPGYTSAPINRIAEAINYSNDLFILAQTGKPGYQSDLTMEVAITNGWDFLDGVVHTDPDFHLHNH